MYFNASKYIKHCREHDQALLHISCLNLWTLHDGPVLPTIASLPADEFRPLCRAQYKDEPEAEATLHLLCIFLGLVALGIMHSTGAHSLRTASMTASCLQIVVASTTIFLAAGRFGLTPSANRLASPGLKLQGNDSGLKTGDPAGFTATDVLYLGTIGETSVAMPVVCCTPSVEVAFCTSSCYCP